MADAETIKQAIAQAVVEAAKAMIITVHEENIKQAISTSHHNTAEAGRPQTGGPSLRQPVFKWNLMDKYIEWKSEMGYLTFSWQNIINKWHRKCNE